EIQKESQEEHHGHHGDNSPGSAARQISQQRMHGFFTAQATEHQREERRTDENHKHHGGDFHGGPHHRIKRADAVGAPQTDRKSRGHQRATDIGGYGGEGFRAAHRSAAQTQ